MNTTELNWKAELWRKIHFFVGVSYFGFSALKYSQNQASSLVVILNLFLGLIFTVGFHKKVFTRTRDLTSWSLLSISLIGMDVFLTMLQYKAYYLEKMYWLLLIPVFAILFVGILPGLIVTLIAFLVLGSYSLRLPALPQEVIELGDGNQLVILIITMSLLFSLAEIIQHEHQVLLEKIKTGIQELYSIWYQQLVKEKVELTLATMSNLRHEINNPGAIVALNLQMLKSNETLKATVNELEAVIFSIQHRLSQIVGNDEKPQLHLSLEQIQAEIQSLNQTVEEKWKFHIILFSYAVAGVTAITVAAFSYFKLSPDWFRIANLSIFAALSAIGIVWILRTKKTEMPVLIFLVAAYIQLSLRNFYDGGIFSNGVIWFAIIPFVFHMGIGGGFTKKLRWLSVISLIGLFILGHTVTDYVRSISVRLFNFTFCLTMVTGLTAFFMTKRQAYLKVLSHLKNRLMITMSDERREFDLKVYQELIDSVLKDIQPLLARAEVLKNELKAKSDSHYTKTIEKALSRIHLVCVEIKEHTKTKSTSSLLMETTGPVPESRVS